MLGDLNRRARRARRSRSRTSATSTARPSPARSRPATHGTGARFRSLSAQVEAVELVLADGSVLEISAAGDPRRPRAPPGSGSARSASSTRSRSAPCPAFTLAPRRPPASRSTRRSRASTRSSTPTTTSSSTSSRTPSRRSAARAAAPTSRRGRARARRASTPQEVMLENWVGGAFALARPPLSVAGIPRDGAARSRAASGARSRSTPATASSPASAAIRSPRWSTGSRASTRAEAVRRVLDMIGARASSAVASRSRSASSPPTTSLLSPSHGRDTCYVAVHQDRRLDWEPYFRAVEEIMSSYGGRPALGQAPLPDRRDAGAALPALGRLPGACARGSIPTGRFANAYTDRVLGA